VRNISKNVNTIIVGVVMIVTKKVVVQWK